LPPPPRARASARARRRPTTPVAPLGSSVARALVYCPAFYLLVGFPRAAAAVAETRRRPSLRLHSGHLQLLGELQAEPDRSPGRQLRRLAGAGRARTAPGQGRDCNTSNCSRVFCARLSAWV
jgi:hypothetical protein